MNKQALLLAAVFAAVVCWGQAAPAELKAAAASRVVTPDPLLPISGGVGEPNPSHEKKGELMVHALVFENNDVRVAIVSTDFLGFPHTLGDKVRAQVKDVKPENIIVGCTHTHSAPDTYGFALTGKSAADPQYLDSVCAKAAEAVNEAAGKLQVAAVKINVDKAKGKIAYNYYAPDLYDPRMGVIQFVANAGDAKGKPIATLINYATHPEIIGDHKGIVSPDLVGPMCDRIREKGAGECVFMNSAQGGMVTADCRGPNGDIETWDECVRIGTLMADEALRIIGEAVPQENPTVFCGATTITFPVESELMQLVLATSPMTKGADAKNVTAQVNVVNIGNAQVLTIPGEALPNVGFYLKRHMAGTFNFLFGLTNDAYGYMLAKVDWNSFERYNYISNTGLGENTAEIYMNEALKFVAACPRPKL